MCLSDFFFPNMVAVTKFGAHEQWKTCEKLIRRTLRSAHVGSIFLPFFFVSRSRCPTARTADSTRLWMFRVRETLPYHICQEQLKPDLSPCQHRRCLHSVRSEGEAMVSATSCHSSLLFFHNGCCQHLYLGQRFQTCSPKAESGLQTCFFQPAKLC